MNRVTYLDKCLPFLFENGEITVKDIQRLTETNCPHSVIQEAVKKGLIDEGEWHENNDKRYKIHKLINQGV